MKKSLLWQIGKSGPRRVKDGKLKLEEHLEAWIVADPDLLQVGLTVIARQLVVEAGRIDLLALDPAGRLVVAEIKRGTLYRETVAQGLDYAECINSLPADELAAKCDEYLKASGKSLRGLLEERDALSQLEHGRREVLLYVVGTGKTDRLERLAQFLQKSIPIYLVIFDIYALADGQQILLRELSEADSTMPVSKPAKDDVSLEALYQQADAAGIGKDFRRFCAAGLSYGLYPRLWKTSAMFAPPESRNRMVFTAWAKPVRKKLKVYLSPEALSEFFPISVSDATSAIGKDGVRELDSGEVTRLLKTLTELFAKFREKTDSDQP